MSTIAASRASAYRGLKPNRSLRSPLATNADSMKRSDSVHGGDEDTHRVEENDTVSGLTSIVPIRRANTDGATSSSLDTRLGGRKTSGFFFGDSKTEDRRWRPQSETVGQTQTNAKFDEDSDDDKLMDLLEESEVAEEMAKHREWLKGLVLMPRKQGLNTVSEVSDSQEDAGDSDDDEDTMPSMGIMRRKTTPASWITSTDGTRPQESQ